jgi:predicted acetyltransferase
VRARVARWPVRLALAVWWALAALGRSLRPRRRPGGHKPAPAPSGVLRGSRSLALAAIAVLVGAASVASFAESYRALYDWAAGHLLSGVWAAVWPLQVDVFIAVGELALFVGLADGWQRRSRVGAWLVTLGGLTVSVAGNVGHVASHALADRATAAVPPLAAAAALAVGLGVLKRVVAAHRRVYGSTSVQPGVPASAPVPAAVPALIPAAANGHDEAASVFAAELEAGEVPSIRRIRARMHVGQPRAREIQAHLEALTPAGQRIRRIRDEIRHGPPVPE